MCADDVVSEAEGSGMSGPDPSFTPARPTLEPSQQAPDQRHENQAASDPAYGLAPPPDTNSRSGGSNLSSLSSLPLATSLVRLFPPYLCGAIVTAVFSTAMVHMSFPDSPSEDCQMTLGILPNKIEYLAMVLFDVHLESEDGQRYVVLQNGSQISISNHIILEGVDEKTSRFIFGIDINSAVQASFKRAMEAGRPRTRSITMSVSMRSSDSATVNLILGLEQGLRLRDILFDG